MCRPRDPIMAVSRTISGVGKWMLFIVPLKSPLTLQKLLNHLNFRSSPLRCYNLFNNVIIILL